MDAASIVCLAAMLFSEASTQDRIAQVGVVQVAINRAVAWGMTPCEVVHHVVGGRAQFHVRRDIEVDDPRLDEYVTLVRRILMYQPPDVTGGALYFTHSDAPPTTLSPLELTVRWDDTRFWRETR